MKAVILDGAATARAILGETAHRVRALEARGVVPALAVIVAGDNPASQLYVRNKTRACAEAGVRGERIALAADADPSELLAIIAALNADPRIHGILVQLPLPPHHDVGAVIEAIAPGKDVDGFGTAHLGGLVAGRPHLAPCTPAGVIELLDRYGIPIDGRDVAVVGRSNIVGKPLAMMMVARGATVTVCHSRTASLAAHTRRADIVVVATGRPQLVTGDMIRPGAVVVDVGINRLPDGRIVGDVDFAGAAAVASHITPVPGGIGPMTVAMLIANTVTAAERASAPAAASVSLA
ncbi:MAG: bifunctional 5,10-methylenetetrahydrofolate dehydrogenase/5,10-methenyltetrahydrofolate cyclohydrolase [Betaproteobacteria bacterium]